LRAELELRRTAIATDEKIRGQISFDEPSDCTRRFRRWPCGTLRLGQQRASEQRVVGGVPFRRAFFTRQPLALAKDAEVGATVLGAVEIFGAFSHLLLSKAGRQCCP